VTETSGLRRPSLVLDVADALRRNIIEKRWVNFLPPTRLLARELLVSVPTIRAAERILFEEKIISIKQGMRVRIIHRPEEVVHRESRPVIGIIQPPSNEETEDILIIRLVEEHLQQLGYSLEYLIESKLNLRRNAESIREVLEKSSAGLWVLVRASKLSQLAVQESGRKGYVVGTPYPDIDLPSLDLAFEAVGRHAARHLLRLRHRNFLIVGPPPRGPGDLDAVAAFIEEIQSAKLKGQPIRVEHAMTSESPEKFLRDLSRVFARDQTPTAIFSISRKVSLTTLTWLLGSGRRIPGDVTVLNRDFSPLLSASVPSLGGYDVDPKTLSLRIARTIDRYFRVRFLKQPTVRVFPDFVPGGTVGEAKH